MSQKTKIGLLAVLIVAGGLATAAVPIVMIAKTAGSSNLASADNKTTTKFNSPAPVKELTFSDRKGMSEASLYDHDFEYVRCHKWWSVPMTKPNLDKFLDQMIAAANWSHYWVTRDGKTIIQSENEQPFYDEYKRSMIPKSLEGITYLHGVLHGAKRPEKSQCLRELKSSLDKAEYKDGAGR